MTEQAGEAATEARIEPEVDAVAPARPAPKPSLEPQEGLAALKPQEEEDLLEIPSFLRRQAN